MRSLWYQVREWGWLEFTGIALSALLTYVILHKYNDPIHMGEALVGIVLVMFAIRAMRWPQLAVLTVFAIFPFERSAVVFSTLNPGSDAMFLLIFGPALMRAWVTRRHTLPNWVTISAGLIVVGSVLTVPFSANHAAAAWGAARWALALNAVLALAGLAVEKPLFRRKVQSVVVAAGGVVGLMGIAQASGHPILTQASPHGSLTSTFSYYSNYGNYAGVIAVLATDLALHAVRTRRWLLASGAAAVAVLSLTQVIDNLSRGALVTVGIGVAALVLWRISKPHAVLGFAVAAIVLAVVTQTFISTETQTKLYDRFTTFQAGDVIRRNMQQVGIQAAAHHPFGIGYYNFKLLITGNGSFGAIDDLTHSHNTFIQMMLEGGWVGGTAFVVLIIGCLIRSGWAAVRSAGASSRAPFAAALLGFCAQVYNDFFFIEMGSLMVFCLLVGGAIPVARTTTPHSAEATVMDAPVARELARL